MYFMSKTISIRIYLSIIFLLVYISNYGDKHTSASFFGGGQLDCRSVVVQLAKCFCIGNSLPRQMKIGFGVFGARESNARKSMQQQLQLATD